MGIPLVITAFGEQAALPAIMATVIMTIFGMTLMIALIEVDLKPRASRRDVVRDVALALVDSRMIKTTCCSWEGRCRSTSSSNAAL